MIPKIIHYCWFGRGKMPPLAHKCIESWAIFLPNYQLKLWNEDNFDIHSVKYVKEAYEARKFAFVTDYVRLFALYQDGGIYLDTDVEIIKNLDSFLDYPAFSGFESPTEVPTGIMASQQCGLWANQQLMYYKNRSFLLPNGSFDLTTNVEIITKQMSENGLKLDNTYQNHLNIIHIFPKDYFCPKNRNGTLSLTENTYCIHHFAGSWQPKKYQLKKIFFQKVLGPAITDFLVHLKKKLQKRFSDRKDA